MLLIFLVFLRHLWPSRLWNAQNCWSKCEPMFHHNSSHCHIQDGLIELISLIFHYSGWNGAGSRRHCAVGNGSEICSMLMHPGHVDFVPVLPSPQLGLLWGASDDPWCGAQGSHPWPWTAMACHGSSYLIMAPASWQTRALFEAAWPGQCSRPMLRLCDFCQKYGQSESWISRPIHVTYVTRKCSQSFIINHTCTSIAYILITWKCVF